MLKRGHLDVPVIGLAKAGWTLQAPEFNAIDASLWFVVTVREFFIAAAPPRALRERLTAAVHAIVGGCRACTRYAIGMDSDGLLACGVPGVQLTWKDAKVGDWVATPRIGKPVEVQALWINALRCADQAARADKAQRAFGKRFWNADTRCLYDVVNVDHLAGKVDASVRPNQIFAIGGLPFALLEGERAAAVLAKVGTELLTPMRLRTLARTSPPEGNTA